MKKQDNKQSIWQTFDIEVTKFNPSKTKKNGLMGYATVYVGGLEIELKNIGVFNTNGHIAISPPTIPLDPETNTSWFRIMDFYNKHDQIIFEKKVLEALPIYCKEHNIPLDLGSGILLV